MRLPLGGHLLWRPPMNGNHLNAATIPTSILKLTTIGSFQSFNYLWSYLGGHPSSVTLVLPWVTAPSALLTQAYKYRYLAIQAATSLPNLFFSWYNRFELTSSCHHHAPSPRSLNPRSMSTPIKAPPSSPKFIYLSLTVPQILKARKEILRWSFISETIKCLQVS